MGFFSDLKTRRAIADLSERLETLERQHKALKLEWESTYDKLHRLAGRIAKRASRESDEAQLPLEPTPNMDNGGPRGVGWSPQQHAAQQQILRRRAGMGS